MDEDSNSTMPFHTFFFQTWWECRPVRAQPERKLKDRVKNVPGAACMGRSSHSSFGKGV